MTVEKLKRTALIKSLELIKILFDQDNLISMSFAISLAIEQIIKIEKHTTAFEAIKIICSVKDMKDKAKIKETLKIIDKVYP